MATSNTPQTYTADRPENSTQRGHIAQILCIPDTCDARLFGQAGLPVHVPFGFGATGCALPRSTRRPGTTAQAFVLHGSDGKLDRHHRDADDRRQTRRMPPVQLGICRLSVDPGGDDPELWAPRRYLWAQTRVLRWGGAILVGLDLVRPCLGHAAAGAVPGPARGGSRRHPTDRKSPLLATSIDRPNVPGCRVTSPVSWGVAAIIGPMLGAFPATRARRCAGHRRLERVVHRTASIRGSVGHALFAHPVARRTPA